MASVRKEIIINVVPEVVWKALGDADSLHTVFPGVLKASRADGERARVVTFANGMTVREEIVDRDDRMMRLVYAAADGGLTTHHNASWELLRAKDGATRLVWISDFLPDTAAPAVRELVDAGAAALKKTLESR